MSEHNHSENIIAGIVGALLFSLGGAVIYFGLYQIGILASVAGLVGVILGIKGYQLFAKKESVKGVIIASVISVLVILLAWYFSFAFSIFQASKEWYANGEIDFLPTFADCIHFVPEYFKDPESRFSCISDIALTLLFTLIGSVGTVITTIKNIKNRASIPAEAVTESNDSIPSSEGFDAPESSSPDSAVLRSASTDEKVKIIAEADAWGHHIVFRKVGKKTEELVVDGLVYAEHETGFISKPYSMSAVVSGHIFSVGYYQSNFIKADDVTIATSIRW